MPEESNDLEAFRAEAQAWLEENFPPSLKGRASEVISGESVSKDPDATEWIRRLGAKGWGTPTWPAEYGGGGLSQKQAQVLNQELDRIGAFNPLIVHRRHGDHDGRPDHPRVRHRGPEEAAPAADLPRRRVLGARLLRAERRLGPRVAPVPGRGQAGDHWMREWPEDLDLGRGRRAVDAACWSAPTRTRPKRDGISFLMMDMEPARDRDASDPADRRRVAVLRDLLQRCEDAGKDELLGRAQRRAGPSASACCSTSGRVRPVQTSGMGGGQRRSLQATWPRSTWASTSRAGWLDPELRARLARSHDPTRKAQSSSRSSACSRSRAATRR